MHKSSDIHKVHEVTLYKYYSVNLLQTRYRWWCTCGYVNVSSEHQTLTQSGAIHHTEKLTSKFAMPVDAEIMGIYK